MSTSNLYQTIAVAALLCTLAWITTRWARRSSGTPLPGPKGWPILGNISDIPKDDPWITFNLWRKQYGDVVGLSILGQLMIVLNSRKAIDALLEKKSSIYSDRPRFSLLTAWGDWGWDLALLPYNEEMHRQRKMAAQCIGPLPSKSYEDYLLQSARKFASQVSHTPDNLWSHLKLMAVANIARVVYGFEIDSLQDDYVRVQEELSSALQEIGPIGTHLVDMFPSLTYLPKYLFGKKFAQDVAQIRSGAEVVFNEPYKRSKTHIEQGTDLKPSMTDILRHHYSSTDGHLTEEYSIKAITAGSYAAGADTTAASLEYFILAMILHPDVQLKAQRAIDEYLKGERLPEFRDRKSLPYLECLLMEVLRWGSVAPLGIPHRLMADDNHKGYLLPAGATVIPNTWGCLHEESDYPNPMTFDPARFLDVDGTTIRKDIPDPRSMAFGFGRRICPGRHIADSTMWITIATALAIFSFSKAVDEEGNVVEPSPEFENSIIIRRLKPYRCTIAPRSPATIDLLNASIEQD